MDTFFNLLFSGLETGSQYALAALGIVLIYRTSVMTNFAQGTLGMFNGFIATVAAATWGIPPWLAAIVGMITAIISGILVDVIIIRRAKKVSAVGKQIITFGIIMLFLGVAPAIFGTKILSFSKFIPKGEFHLLGTTLTYNGALNIFIGLLLMAIIFAFLQYTKYGLAVRTTASNEVVSRLMGIPTKLITMGSWATAAALGTLAALMVAPLVGVHTSMMDTVQISAFLAVVLGGLQTFYGPVIGAYIIAIGSNFAIYYINDKWGLQIVYLFIILVLYIKPVGLFGKKRIKKV